MSVMAMTQSFHWADYLVVVLFFVFSIGLGLFIAYRDRSKSTTSKEFLLGGGDMHWIPTALSMQASFLSAVTLISTPTEIYTFGTMYAFFCLSYMTALPIAAYMYMPTFYNLKLTSGYEYLEVRFNRTVRLAGSVTFSFMSMLYLSVVLYTPALALAQVSGLSVELSIIVCGIVCTVYTVLGGMKATMWNDFFQMLIVIAGLLMVIIIGSVRLGGMNKVWQTNIQGNRINFVNFNPDPTVRTTFWSQIIGGTTIHVAMYASSQTVIQKFLSVKTLKLAQRSVWTAATTSVFIFILVVIIGLIMYAFYETCDPMLRGRIERADQLVPLFIMELMGDLHGLPGLFIASAFSAALSSVSGSLNALSAVFLVDFIHPVYVQLRGSALTERVSNIITRLLTAMFGALTIFLGLAAKYMGSLVLQIALSIFGFLGGPLTGVLSLGLFFPFVNTKGALAGLVSSLIISSWVAVGSIIHNNTPLPKLAMTTDGCFDSWNVSIATTPTNYSGVETTSQLYNKITSEQSVGLGETNSQYILWIYRVSYMYYGLISMTVAFVVGIIVSLLTGPSKDTDVRLTFSWAEKCCCYCSTSCQSFLACGARQSEETSVEVLKFGKSSNVKIIPVDPAIDKFQQVYSIGKHLMATTDVETGNGPPIYANVVESKLGISKTSNGSCNHSTDLDKNETDKMTLYSNEDPVYYNSSAVALISEATEDPVYYNGSAVALISEATKL